MRFPTARQFRVSSNFNPRRLNPVTGRVAPHRGVDFAMPQGTPVLAVGDGEVVVAKRSGAAGYYVASAMVAPIPPAICTCVSCW
jgi:murein DD-endopeptidase